jgi:hypothetical protein
MHSLLRSTVLAASALVACSGIPGCSTETDSDTGKMAKPMDKVDIGKMGGAMDKMDTGKMGGAMNKMDTGKMDPGKMETLVSRINCTVYL